MKSMPELFAAIPERVARAPSGTRFAPQAERLRYLSQFIHWLTPFAALNAEGQQALGLLAARDKPLDRDEDEHLESEEA
jgi:hypothetical protein